jgi:uncharacterized membrane protein YkoI
MTGWITNNPEAAKALCAADLRYERAKSLASGLKLSQKVEAYRAAKAAREAEYAAVSAGAPPC